MSGIRVTDETLILNGLQYCREYLGGSWAKAKREDFEVVHITGGLSNMLYKCSLKEDFPIRDDEHRNVLLRLYGQIIKEDPKTVLNDSVVFTLLAERNMGPKLYGVFTQGRIEEYVPSRVLFTHELHEPVISRACARIMARFHRLQMPMMKKPIWLFDIISRYLEDCKPDKTEIDCNGQYTKLLDFNLIEEYQNLKALLNRVNSPVVFCHNDLQEGNILYIGNSGTTESTQDIVRPIDFEYSSYNFRGFDIGNHFCEWCYNYHVSTPPYYSANIDHFPSKEQQLTFIREYLRESNLSSDEEDSVLLEANAFALASHFLWCAWSIVQKKKSQIVFGYLEYGVDRLDAYLKQKPLVLKQIEDYEAKRSARQASR